MQENQNQHNNIWKNTKDIMKSALLALVIIIPFRIFIAQPFLVNGLSMYPTFNNGDYLIVDQLSKRFEMPKRGSIIIIKFPENHSRFLIKRLIGLPQEKIVINDGILFVDGKQIEEPYIKHKKIEGFQITLKEDEYFVMGDNRAGSSDSRIWGPIKKEEIVGRPIIRLLPLNNIGLID